MSISLIQALLDDQVAELHEELLERGEIDGLPAAHAFQGGVNVGLLHHPPRQGRVERRQGERAVLVDLDELAPRAEQEDRAELRVEAAADDDLVAVAADHRLDGHALDVPGSDLPAHRVVDGAKARRTASASARFSCTPPTSVLCVIVSEKSLTTTG